MTIEEKNEMYSKTVQKHIKGRKSKTIALIVLPCVGVAISLLLSGAGKIKQTEISEATVLDSMSIGEFLEQNANGSAIYTGDIKAVDPAICSEESGEYISFHHTIKQEITIYDEKSEKYETETTTISDESDSCPKIEIDNIIVPTGRFHDLPVYSKTRSEGAASNQFKTNFSYTPAHLEGTFFLKCKNGEVASVRYYESADVAGEINNRFSIARVIMWIFIIGIEVFLVIDIIKTSKTIKIVESKIQ
ncbi:MAG: hypothetical protein K6G58_06295 [Lachnospiraceae bacterium]|nr:hypothetical protein [Lachnospiraceae bacterium]